MPGRPDTTDITVPAELGYVRVLRLSAAGALSLFEFDHVFVENVKAAVGEAAALVIGANRAPGRLYLTMRCDEDSATVAMRGQFTSDPETTSNADDLAELPLARLVSSFSVDAVRRTVSFTMKA